MTLRIEIDGHAAWYGDKLYLVEGKQGDRASLKHLGKKQSSTGVSYLAAVDMFTPPVFDRVDGGKTTLKVAFVSSTTKGITVTFPTSASRAGRRRSSCRAAAASWAPASGCSGSQARSSTGCTAATADLLQLSVDPA